MGLNDPILGFALMRSNYDTTSAIAFNHSSRDRVYSFTRCQESL
jgi:hypothetical protein